jgi:hypothetical protein
MTLLEFINAFKSNEHYKKHFSFSGLEVLYNYLLTLDEDIEFCEGGFSGFSSLYFLDLSLITKPPHNSPNGSGGSNATKYLPVFTSFSPFFLF